MDTLERGVAITTIVVLGLVAMAVAIHSAKVQGAAQALAAQTEARLTAERDSARAAVARRDTVFVHDTVLRGVDSGRYAALERRWEAAEAKLIPREPEARKQPPAPGAGHLDSLLAALALADTAITAGGALSASCSLVQHDCAAELAGMRREVVVADSQAAVWRMQRPDFWQRHEGAVCGVTGGAGAVLGFLLGRVSK